MIGKGLLITVVFVPVLLGVFLARRSRLRRGLVQLLVSTLAFDIFYIILLYLLGYAWL